MREQQAAVDKKVAQATEALREERDAEQQACVVLEAEVEELRWVPKCVVGGDEGRDGHLSGACMAAAQAVFGFLVLCVRWLGALALLRMHLCSMFWRGRECVHVLPSAHAWCICDRLHSCQNLCALVFKLCGWLRGCCWRHPCSQGGSGGQGS